MPVGLILYLIVMFDYSFVGNDHSVLFLQFVSDFF